MDASQCVFRKEMAPAGRHFMLINSKSYTSCIGYSLTP